ncbi:unnamed protein product [Echinostoma caproni]|uniref:Obg domain-containing protein n=1 Tax=Echinostoma caproni TaxID=27848 RepID=A0A183B686_9TREM|nr:unnamed protein product [Echinostoma caproni]
MSTLGRACAKGAVDSGISTAGKNCCLEWRSHRRSPVTAGRGTSLRLEAPRDAGWVKGRFGDPGHSVAKGTGAYDLVLDNEAGGSGGV